MEFRCPVFCGPTASTGSSYKISGVWGPQGRTAHLAGSPAAEKRRARCCGQQEPRLCGARGALRVASSPCPPSRRPSSGATRRQDPTLRSAAGRSTPASPVPASSTSPTSIPRGAVRESVPPTPTSSRLSGSSLQCAQRARGRGEGLLARGALQEKDAQASGEQILRLVPQTQGYRSLYAVLGIEPRTSCMPGSHVSQVVLNLPSAGIICKNHQAMFM
ncbi:uncharacterized protein LOC118594267 [Onychomys torridus]|uniref:uncharacterized protein LOC118594267 n=1 Tax=Onychomys torridus TaxID=38674 RepID=UPI00167F84C0|nr:uncharacterized protein LOC118594267 [Onychomys torridus]